jgi:hypothetical protein
LKKELKATDIGPLAAKTLPGNSESEIMGEVIAVFPNSLYIKTVNAELIFVTGRRLRSPITINLHAEVDLPHIVTVHDQVGLSGDAISVGPSLLVKLSGASQFTLENPPRGCQLAITKSTLRLASLLLMIIDNGLSVLDSQALAHAGVSKFVTDGLLPFLRENDQALFRSTALSIVGLGTGFTPSGDDLLGGFLAAYNRFIESTGHQTITIGFDLLETRTQWISAKLLDYMQREILDDQVLSLIEASTSQESDAFILALESLLPRGHTSGIDILVGMLLALGSIHDIVRKDNITEVLAKNLCLY